MGQQRDPNRTESRARRPEHGAGEAIQNKREDRDWNTAARGTTIEAAGLLPREGGDLRVQAGRLRSEAGRDDAAPEDQGGEGGEAGGGGKAPQGQDSQAGAGEQGSRGGALRAGRGRERYAAKVPEVSLKSLGGLIWVKISHRFSSSAMSAFLH